VQDVRNIFCLNIFLKKESFYWKVKIRSLIETVPLYLTRQRPGGNSRFRNLDILKKLSFSLWRRITVLMMKYLTNLIACLLKITSVEHDTESSVVAKEGRCTYCLTGLQQGSF
jgi:hypothetical protein